MSYDKPSNWWKEIIPGPQTAAIWLLIVPSLYFIAKSNYFLFHTIVEGFAVIVAALIYVLATKTYKYSENSYLLFLGNAYFFIGVLDFFHLLTYYRTGCFSAYGLDIPTQLWVAGRYVEAFSLCLVPLFTQRRFSFTLVFRIYAIVTAFVILAIMWLRIFPSCFIEGYGLTDFKIISEFIICLIIIGGIRQLYLKQEQTGYLLYSIMMTAMTITIFSELSFTLYKDVYGTMNFMGHIFKIVSYYLIYCGIVLRGLKAPYDSIFQKLKANAISDSLTGLYNRYGFMEFAKTWLAKACMEGSPIGILVIDIDKFKKINDQYGHQTGDKVLQQFAGILRSSIGKADIACRMGGDEFIVLVHGGQSRIEVVKRQVREAVREWTANDLTVREIGISIGSALWEPGQAENIDVLIKKADQEMYQEKEAKRNKPFKI